jgi:hypothetical protein
MFTEYFSYTHTNWWWKLVMESTSSPDFKTDRLSAPLRRTPLPHAAGLLRCDVPMHADTQPVTGYQANK